MHRFSSPLFRVCDCSAFERRSTGAIDFWGEASEGAGEAPSELASG